MKLRNRQSHSLALPHSRWMAYALAGVATAAGGTMSAEGAIHYSGRVDVKLAGTQKKVVATFQLDRPGDSIVFQHLDQFETNYASFKVLGIHSRKFAGSEGIDLHSASRLPRGEYVSQRHLTAPDVSEFISLAPGQFQEQGIGYIGFQFNGGSGAQLGWARVRMGGKDRGYGFVVLDYAYADPGEPIRTGQTSSDSSVPDQSALGLLAFGAAGLAAWRKSSKSRGHSASP